MRSLFSILSTLAWSLWFGGLIAVFVIATGMFSRDRALALQANPAIFAIFERYQLIIGAAALICLLGWRIAGGGLLVSAIFALLALAAAAAVIEPLAISSKMQQLVRDSQTDSPQFRKLHGYSMMLYCAEGGVLLAAGLLLPAALRRPRPQTTLTADSPSPPAEKP
jgi:hypothetical protein